MHRKAEDASEGGGGVGSRSRVRAEGGSPYSVVIDKNMFTIRIFQFGDGNHLAELIKNVFICEIAIAILSRLENLACCPRTIACLKKSIIGQNHM